jgi:arylsulfatase A-like enzyme
MGHPRVSYQHQLFVPLLVKFPGQQAGAVVEEEVSLVDVLPSVMEAVGGGSVRDTDGRDLASLRESPRTAVFGEANRGKGPRPYPRHTAVLSKGWKLLAHEDGRRELYHLDEDPAEAEDLAAREPEKAAEMGRILEEWRAATPKYAGAAKPMSPAALERLRSLGYIR